MKLSSRNALEAFLVGYWVLSVNFLSGISVLSVRTFNLTIGIPSQFLEDPMAVYWLSWQQYLESTLFGFLFGICFVWVDRYFRRPKFSGLSFGKLIIRKTSSYLLGIFLTFLTIYLILNAAGVYKDDIATDFLMNPVSILLILMIFGGIVFQIFLLNFLLQSIETSGFYNITRFLTGKYQFPVEEKRIFMFLDLDNSTTHAENLGNLQYSRMIQDCFLDLNKLIKDHQAEIYQYVGDEVVLNWNPPNPETARLSIDLFFSFKSTLEKRAAHYRDSYGIIPSFKAACYAGDVTVTEVGFVKREIAFHGDVLNIASRLEHLNKDLGTEILVGERMKSLLGSDSPYHLNPKGEFLLKGKGSKLNVYEVIT